MPILVYQTVKNAGMPHARIKKVVAAALRQVKSPRASVAVHLVGETRMRTLNRTGRGIDRPTDVLSFPTGERDDWGDIFLCVPYLRRQAKRFGVSFEEEFCRMLIHGVLHLSGLDHDAPQPAKRMFGMQEAIVSRRI
jgi:probable rRNA maturation factor